MRKVVLLGLAVALGVLGVSAVAFAGRGHGKGDFKHFSARLNGWEEDPSQVTTGKGSFRAEIVSSTRIDFTLKYKDLEGPPLMAHIHIGSRHESGGISAWLCAGPRSLRVHLDPTVRSRDDRGSGHHRTIGQGSSPAISPIDPGDPPRRDIHQRPHGIAGPPASGRAPGARSAAERTQARRRQEGLTRSRQAARGGGGRPGRTPRREPRPRGGRSESARWPIGLTTISPPRTTGRSKIRPMLKIGPRGVHDRRLEEHGELPALVTVKVAPRRSRA